MTRRVRRLTCHRDALGRHLDGHQGPTPIGGSVCRYPRWGRFGDRKPTFNRGVSPIPEVPYRRTDPAARRGHRCQRLDMALPRRRTCREGNLTYSLRSGRQTCAGANHSRLSTQAVWPSSRGPGTRNPADLLAEVYAWSAEHVSSTDLWPYRQEGRRHTLKTSRGAAAAVGGFGCAKAPTLETQGGHPRVRRRR
jgi:hypothetical protein